MSVFAQVVNEAGIGSDERCSNGVTVGKAAALLQPDKSSNIMLSTAFSNFGNATSGAANVTGPVLDNSTETLVVVRVPPSAVQQNQTFVGGDYSVGSDGSTNATNVPAELPPSHVMQYEFGGRMFSMEVEGSLSTGAAHGVGVDGDYGCLCLARA